MRAKYGIDAPGLVRTFPLVGSALLLGSGLFFILAGGSRPWATWFAVILMVPSIYSLGMCFLMLAESLVTKVRDREILLDLVSWKGEETVLDVGCGRGLMLVGAAHRLSTGRAIGVDIWRASDQSSNHETGPIENARAEGVSDRVAVETADMRNLPFADQTFDVVMSNWAVHNVEAESDRAQALCEMVRVLRPGGTVLLSDIVNRNEYIAQLTRLGLDAQLVVTSEFRDWFLRTVSFGAYQPAAIVARACGGAGQADRKI